MSNKQRRKRKKNQQVQVLNKAIKNNTGAVENTTVQGATSLSGSDESDINFNEYTKNEKKEKISSKPYKYIIADYVKDKGIGSTIVGIIATIVISVAGWSLLKTIEMDKNLAEHRIRLENLREM